MVMGNVLTIKHEASRLSEADVSRIMSWALKAAGVAVVVIDVQQTVETTTAALARLVLLRRRLLKTGRDLRLMGLAGPAEGLYEITRMMSVLPRVERPIPGMDVTLGVAQE
jgi:aspartate ammonia-lyase